jgi:hypothetical protein
MMRLIVSCAENFIGIGGTFDHPYYDVHELLSVLQMRSLDIRMTSLEVCGDDPGLVRALPIRQSNGNMAGQDLLGKKDKASRVLRLEALVGNKAPFKKGKDLDHSGLSRGSDERLHALGISHNTRQADTLDAGE